MQDADSLIFLPSFLNMLNGIQVLRLMDWFVTNNNPLNSWSDRPTITAATYSTKGVPYEIAIALANLSGKEIWVNVPAMVDESYILQMATLFKQLLNPNSVFYIEYSNELWNFEFLQSGYNVEQAIQMMKSNMTFLNFDNVNNEFQWAFRRTAYMAMRISDIFAQVFGESKRNVQFRVVLAGQGANSFIITTGLDMISKVFGPPSQYF